MDGTLLNMLTCYKHKADKVKSKKCGVHLYFHIRKLNYFNGSVSLDIVFTFVPDSLLDLGLSPDSACKVYGSLSV